MKRSSFLMAGAGALLFPTQALARKRGDGYSTIPYTPLDAEPYFRPGPDLVRNRAQLDPAIRDTVLRINESGWVWTAESCQGHVGGWSHAPMLRLVCREDDAGAMLALLAGSVRVGGIDPPGIGTELRIVRHVPASRGWYEARVFVHHKGGTMGQGRRVLARFAEAVNR